MSGTTDCGFDIELVAGEPFRLGVYVTETAAAPTDPEVSLPLAVPASLDVRKGPSQTDPLVLRFDHAPDTVLTEGSITEDGLPRGGLIISLDDTRLLQIGRWFYDLWACYESDPGTPRLIMSGRFVVSDRVTGVLE